MKVLHIDLQNNEVSILHDEWMVTLKKSHRGWHHTGIVCYAERFKYMPKPIYAKCIAQAAMALKTAISRQEIRRNEAEQLRLF